MHKNTQNSVPRDRRRTIIFKQTMNEVLTKAYKNNGVHIHVDKLNQCGTTRLHNIFHNVISGQSRVVAECISKGLDVRLDHLGTFKQKAYRKLFLKHKKDIIEELGLSAEDLKNVQVRDNVNFVARKRTRIEYESNAKPKYKKPIVINHNFKRIVNN